MWGGGTQKRRGSIVAWQQVVVLHNSVHPGCSCFVCVCVCDDSNIPTIRSAPCTDIKIATHRKGIIRLATLHNGTQTLASRRSVRSAAYMHHVRHISSACRRVLASKVDTSICQSKTTYLKTLLSTQQKQHCGNRVRSTNFTCLIELVC